MVSHPLFLERNSISDVYVHLSDIRGSSVHPDRYAHVRTAYRSLAALPDPEYTVHCKKESDNVIIPGCTTHPANPDNGLPIQASPYQMPDPKGMCHDILLTVFSCPSDDEESDSPPLPGKKHSDLLR